mmetsp:Transcript_1949/g.2773  ORF Transcript_1949/g.2773 Transcript_1949/m.2773 type:complete len:200 (+) Transcript_1949:659-1258(+)
MYIWKPAMKSRDPSWRSLATKDLICTVPVWSLPVTNTCCWGRALKAAPSGMRSFLVISTGMPWKSWKAGGVEGVEYSSLTPSSSCTMGGGMESGAHLYSASGRSPSRRASSSVLALKYCDRMALLMLLNVCSAAFRIFICLTMAPSPVPATHVSNFCSRSMSRFLKSVPDPNVLSPSLNLTCPPSGVLEICIDKVTHES